MSAAGLLTTVRYYTPLDVYYYSVDNRPLTDLDSNSQALAAYIDKLHPGRVDVTGAATPTVNAAPTGWTVTRSGTGVYVVTHNLNTTAYSVLCTCYAAGVAYPSGLGANSFTVNLVNFSGTAIDAQFVAELTEI